VTAPLIEVTGLTKSMRAGRARHRILDGLSLTVNPGQSTAILGRSGSGKSTLLSLLALFDRADGGSYRFDGREVAKLPEREGCRLRSDRFGFVFQRFFLLNHLTAAQNVLLSLMNGQRDVPRHDRRRLAHTALDQVGLADLAQRRPPELSGGEQQRVAIARALVGRPSVVFADEPTGALDSGTGEMIVNVLLSLAAQGTTTVMVTHDRGYAARMERVLTLDRGRLSEGMPQ
jgi:putative ABC transport system ATP-binding protein